MNERLELFYMSTFGENGGGNTVVAITGHESDATDEIGRAHV